MISFVSLVIPFRQETKLILIH